MQGKSSGYVRKERIPGVPSKFLSLMGIRGMLQTRVKAFTNPDLRGSDLDVVFHGYVKIADNGP